MFSRGRFGKTIPARFGPPPKILESRVTGTENFARLPLTTACPATECYVLIRMITDLFGSTPPPE